MIGCCRISIGSRPIWLLQTLPAVSSMAPMWMIGRRSPLSPRDFLGSCPVTVCIRGTAAIDRRIGRAGSRRASPPNHARTSVKSVSIVGSSIAPNPMTRAWPVYDALHSQNKPRYSYGSWSLLVRRNGPRPFTAMTLGAPCWRRCNQLNSRRGVSCSTPMLDPLR